MELDLERRERISAPLQLVWDETGSLEQVLTKSPQVSNCEIAPGGVRAKGIAKLAWGPVKWAVDLDVTLLELVVHQHIRYAIEAIDLGTRAETTINLLLVGINETDVGYHSVIEVQHRIAARMRGLFNEIAEGQAHSILHRVKVRSEQRRLANERLLP